MFYKCAILTNVQFWPSDGLLSLSYLNMHFLWRKLYWKTVIYYVIFNTFWHKLWHNFSVYKHHCKFSHKQIFAVILKPNSKVTSIFGCLRKFLVIQQLRLCMYLLESFKKKQIFVHKKGWWIALCRYEFVYAYAEFMQRNWHTKFCK